MRLTDHLVADATVRAWGETDAVELSVPLEGVLRLRLAPELRTSHLGFPRLPEKHSFALAPEQPAGLALEVQEHGDLLTTTAGGLTAELDRRTGAWTVRQGDAVLAQALDWSGQPPAARPALDAERFSLHRSRLALAAPDGAAYLGFGEKVGPLDKRGMALTFWNTDCFPHHTETDPLYVSIPFTTVVHGDGRACGLFLDEPWRLEADVAKAHAHELRWTSAGPELDVYVIAGPTPVGVLARYVSLTGRAPMPPLWALGAAQSRWGYTSEHDLKAVIRGYRERDLPLDAVYIDIDYMNAYKVWTFDPQRFPDPRRFVTEARAQGVQLVPIIDPGVKLEAGYPVYEEAAAAGHLVQTARGDVLVGEVWPDPAVFPDFTRPEVRAWWAGWHRVLAEAGIRGQWNDMNEPANFSLPQGGGAEGKTLPFDARHGLRSHLEVHNAYANGMNEASRQGYARHAPDLRPWLITRAGYAGIQRSAAVWTGDNTSAWSHLALSLPMVAGLGLSGVPYSAPDVGGFGGDATGELLARWYQTALGYTFVRNHSALGTAMQEPWRFGEPFLGVIRAALKLRYRLLPHLYTLVWQAAQTGMPVLTPLALHFPTDPDALREDTQYLLGEHLLIAPVLRAGHRKRLVYLPEGEWLPAANLTLGQPLPGLQFAVASAPLDTLPMYLRAGGGVPLTEPADHTTTARWPALTWLIHAGEQVSGTLYEDAGDGHAGGRVTRLSGGLDGKTLTLRRAVEGEGAAARERETLLVAGLNGVQAVDGATDWTFENGLLSLQVGADWTRLDIKPEE